MKTHLDVLKSVDGVWDFLYYRYFNTEIAGSAECPPKGYCL